MREEHYDMQNQYDHLLVFDKQATTELLLDARTLDVRRKAGSNKAFYQNISDHLPIVAHFSRSRYDDD